MKVELYFPDTILGGSMPATRRMKEVLAAKASANFLGRERELRMLTECVEGQGPVVAWVHGVPGIGKTALLQEFTARAAATGIRVIRLDCRFMEPTPDGFLSELQRALGSAVETIHHAADALASGGRTVLILDSYEVFRLMDSWLRQTFIPALDVDTRIALSGRYGPGPGWRTSLEWQGLVRPIAMSSLNEADSVALLKRLGVQETATASLHRIARGHPMALVLAGSAERSAAGAAAQDAGNLVQQLTQLYLAEVTDPVLRTAVEAASVVRRMTQSLLAAMLPDHSIRELYERLALLPIVEASSEGLMIHGQVQDAVSSWLHSSDPQRFRMYRRAALRQLRSESQQAVGRERWRYTADMLYLVQNPNVREAFFPSGAQSLAVEPARDSDREAILAIAHAHETTSAAAAIACWWQRLPRCFHVMRDGSGAVSGFFIEAEWRSVRGSLPESDPLVHQWQRHLREQPVAKDETSIYVRRWLSEGAGEMPSPVQASCWLEVKRTYLALRPSIRRCYVSLNDLAFYGPIVQPLGFQVVPGSSTSFDGAACHLAFLDFGPGSIDGWLAAVIASELGVPAEGVLDLSARELVIEGERVGLTALEFGVLRYLQQQEGKAVSRAELLERVWEQRPDSSSNVVDVVIRSLREKLGSRASILSTVRGVGYRLRSQQH